jgi:hypothetical protein
VTSGHLALDRRGWHSFDQGLDAHLPNFGSDQSRHLTTAETGPMSSPATDDNDAEASRRPLGPRDGDSRRPPGESPDHLGKSWGNQVIAHTLALRRLRRNHW